MLVALVLFSAFLHALWNALLRLEKDKDRALVGAIVVASIFATVVATARYAATSVDPFLTLAALGFTLLAGAFEGTYFATLARAMDRGKLGTVYTISRGGALLVVWPLSIALYGEVATIPSTLGSGLVLGGIALCGYGAGRAMKTGTSSQGGAVAWAIASAASIAGYHLAYKAALRTGASPSACFAVSLSLSAMINLTRLRTARLSVLRARTLRVSIMGIVCGGSFLILMEALARGGSGYVLTLRNTSVLFAAGLAAVIGERPQRLEVLGALLVATGAVCMAW